MFLLLLEMSKKMFLTDLDKSRKTQGIFVDFKFLEDGSYGVYFMSTIKDRIYIVDK